MVDHRRQRLQPPLHVASRFQPHTITFHHPVAVPKRHPHPPTRAAISLAQPVGHLVIEWLLRSLGKHHRRHQLLMRRIQLPRRRLLLKKLLLLRHLKSRRIATRCPMHVPSQTAITALDTSRSYLSIGSLPTPNPDPAMRLGLFGGSFDPVHYGHLLLAECCREQCRLDAVWFVPAAVPPHKQDQELSPAADRIEMLKLAIGGHDVFDVYTGEIDRGGVSFTVETLEQLHEESPDTEMFFLMGADSLGDLPTWREPKRICELAIPAVVRRAGSPEPDDSALARFMSPARLEIARAEPRRNARDRSQRHRHPPPRGRRPKHPLPHSPRRGKIHRSAGTLSKS